ncbi:hypothetical protein BMETH_2770_0 [methanotrophic bacterial endosymbiont of Bathymodiolus sp.]|nr:hypothetical protein BMETH_2770_0 [methanotrophic bacterial endosymbiont of Bathymodiolus sp.]
MCSRYSFVVIMYRSLSQRQIFSCAPRVGCSSLYSRA